MVLLVVVGCDSGTQAPIAFPARAYVGETVSFAVSTDSVSIPEVNKSHDISKENVEIRLTDPNDASQFVVVTPRSVIAGASATGTSFSEQNGVAELSIATFDVPQTLPSSFVIPGTLWLTAHRLPGGELVGGTVELEIVGPASEGSGPTSFHPFGAENQLQPRPSLRVRALWPGFDSAWVIGSVQFEISYPASVSNPRAFARLQAAKGLAFAKDVAAGSARILVVDPRGFQLPAPIGADDELGGGPFVDIIFGQSQPFTASEFTISNLLVTDLDGNVLVDNPGDASGFFRLYARANQ
jgi:hypothetical protein